MLRTLLLLTLIPWLSISLAHAQPSPEQPDVSARELLEAEEQAEKLIEQRVSTDPNALNDQATPLAAMLGLREAMRADDDEALGKFLDRRYVGEDIEQYSDEQLMRALGYVFFRQNIIELTALSDEPKGRLDDGLPDYRDQIGTVKLAKESIPIYLESTRRQGWEGLEIIQCDRSPDSRNVGGARIQRSGD